MHVSQLIAHPHYPGQKATPGPTQRAVISGQLFATQLGHNVRFCPSTYSPPVKKDVETHKETDTSLRGGSSGHNRALQFPRDVLNNNGPQDVQHSLNGTGSDSTLRSASQSQQTHSSSAIATIQQQRTLVSAPNSDSIVSSTPRRLDPIVEGLDEAALNEVLLKDGINPETKTLQEKKELAQNNLDRWREEQRRRLRAPSHPIAQSSQHSELRRRSAAQNQYSPSNSTGLAAGTPNQIMERLRVINLARDKSRPSFPRVAAQNKLAPQENGRQSLQHGRSHHGAGSHLASQTSFSYSLFEEITDEVTGKILAPGPGRCGIVRIWDKHGHVVAEGSADYQKMEEQSALEDSIVAEVHLEKPDEVATQKGKEQDSGKR